MSAWMRQVAEEQAARLAKQERELAEVRRRLVEGSAPRQSSAHVGRWSLGFAMAAALAVWASWPEHTLLRVGNAVVREGEVLDASQGAVEGAWSDGSTLTLREGGTARVTRTSGRGAEVALERGSAHVYVAPRAGAEWRYHAGPYTVRVTGTRFDLGWDPARERFELAMDEGTVELGGPGLDVPRSVHAGERMVLAPAQAASPPPASATASAAAPGTQSAATPAAFPGSVAPTGEPSTSATSRAAASESTWRDLAREAKYREAFARLGAELDALLARGSAADLLLAADAARLSGHAAEGRRALDALRRRHPRAREAAHAAFQLGRDAHGSGRHAEAATWFRTYLAEAPSGGFARDALGRLLECETATGDAAARATASRYLASYPTGPHAALAQRFASPVPSASAATP